MAVVVVIVVVTVVPHRRAKVEYALAFVNFGQVMRKHKRQRFSAAKNFAILSHFDWTHQNPLALASSPAKRQKIVGSVADAADR